MSKTCPAHGFRRLGQIYVVKVGDTSRGRTMKIDEKSIGLDELVQEYDRRLAQVEQAEDEQEYDRQEP